MRSGRSETVASTAVDVRMRLVIEASLPHDAPMRDPRDDIEDRRDDVPQGLYFSRRGNWFHDGDRVFHVGLSSLLNRSVTRDKDDNLIVTTGMDVLPFIAEDAPLVVRSVEQVVVDGAHSLQLKLSTGVTEPLVGAITRGEDERLRVVVDSGRFWALLARSAAQTLEPLLNDKGVVAVGEHRHPMVTATHEWAKKPTPPTTTT